MLPSGEQRSTWLTRPASFNSANLFSSGLVFAVNQQKYDASYILTSLQFARKLFQYDTEVSSVELKLKSDVNIGSVKKKIQAILGDGFRVQDRYEQQVDTFRIMEIEKLIFLSVSDFYSDDCVF